MLPRRAGVVVVVVLAAVALAFFLWPEGERTQESEVASSTRTERVTRSATSAAAAEEAAFPQQSAASPGEAVHGATRPLDTPPLASAGAVELQVRVRQRSAASAKVRLYLRGARDPNTNEIDWRLAGAGATNEDGKIRLPAAPGEYLAVARLEGSPPVSKAFTRPAGEPLTAVQLDISGGVTLSGRVIEKGDRSPVPLAEITLVPSDANYLPSAPAEEQQETTSDPRGQYRFAPLNIGTYRLIVKAPGHARLLSGRIEVPEVGKIFDAELTAAGVLEGTVTFADGKPAGGAQVTVVEGSEPPVIAIAGPTGAYAAEVHAGVAHVTARSGDAVGASPLAHALAAGATVRGVDVRLGGGGAIEGTVTSHLKVIRGAQILVSPWRANGDSGRSVTDHDGHYRVGALPPGAFDVVIKAEGYSEIFKRGVHLAADQIFALDVELDATSTLEGHVTDERGAPLIGASVRARTSNELKEAKTGEDGSYRLQGLPIGQVWISAHRAGEGNPDSVKSVTLRAGQVTTADFRLPVPGSIAGKVKLGAGVESAWVQCLSSSEDRQTFQVDAAGLFKGGLVPGAWNVRAVSERNEFRGPQVPVTIEAGKTTEVELALSDDRQGSRLSGVVLEPNGSPSPNAYLGVRGTGAWLGDASTDESGRFTLQLNGEPKPPINVFARNGGRSVELKLERLASPLTLQLLGAGTVIGTLRAGAAPYQGAFTVSLAYDPSTPNRGGGSLTGELSFSGSRFEVGDLPAEALVVTIKTADGRSARAKALLTSGAPKEIALELEAAAVIKGRVLDAGTREPIAGATVVLDGAWTSSEQTAGDGRYSFTAVPAGAHGVRHWSPDYDVQERKITTAPGESADLGDVLLALPAAARGTIGVEVTGGQGRVLLEAPLRGGPAAKAGLQAGDQLVAIDGTPVGDPQEARNKLRGASGSSVSVTVRRGGSELTLPVTRA